MIKDTMNSPGMGEHSIADELEHIPTRQPREDEYNFHHPGLLSYESQDKRS